MHVHKIIVSVRAAFTGLLAISLIVGCATIARTKEADRAIAQAHREIEATDAVGHLWRIADPATGNDPHDLELLVAHAQQMKRDGDLDAALRIVRRVIWAARAGRQQAREEADAGPLYQ